MHCTVQLKALIPARSCWHKRDWVVSSGVQQRWAVSKAQEMGGFWKIGTFQSVTKAMEEDIHFKSNFPEMVIPTQGMAQHSTGAVVDLSAPPGSITHFLDEPQGNHSPPGCPKHGRSNWLLQELKLKPTLSSPLNYFTSFWYPEENKNITMEVAWRMLFLMHPD